MSNQRVPLPPETLKYTLDEAIELMELGAEDEARRGHGSVKMSVIDALKVVRAVEKRGTTLPLLSNIVLTPPPWSKPLQQ